MPIVVYNFLIYITSIPNPKCYKFESLSTNLMVQVKNSTLDFTGTM